MRNIKNMWWKYLSIILILYALLAGMLVPLKPGVQVVSPDNVRIGDVKTLQISGYNTFFATDAGSTRVWLKYDDRLSVQAKAVRVKSDRLLEADVEIPKLLPNRATSAYLSVIVDNPSTGVAILPGGVYVSAKDTVFEGASIDPWLAHPIADLHFQKDVTYPYRNILYETIRNTYYHVPLWFAMIALFGASVYFSVLYLLGLSKEKSYEEVRHFDLKAVAFAEVGLIFGILGLTTGMIWANYTWGAPWSGDVKQNMSAVLLGIYFAYIILRMGLNNRELAGRVGAAYNIFAFVSVFPLLFIIPRMTASLHPGSDGNPAMGTQDLDNTMRLVFYPAVIGFILLGWWLSELSYRMSILKSEEEEE